VSETGVVKFTCEHVDVALPLSAPLAELNACRRRLLQLRLLGVGADGIGFGNVSIREAGTENFYITGSGTGAARELSLTQIARVTAYDLDRNWLRCEGSSVASSESLTHAAIYAVEPEAAAVIHCHSHNLWQRLREVAPTTAGHIEYGTPEMAREVQRLFTATTVRQERIFVMGGHEDGMVAFGRTLDAAFDVIQRAIVRRD